MIHRLVQLIKSLPLHVRRRFPQPSLAADLNDGLDEEIFHERMSLCRKYLSLQPSYQMWEQLLSLFGGVNQEQYDVMIRYLQAHMEKREAQYLITEIEPRDEPYQQHLIVMPFLNNDKMFSFLKRCIKKEWKSSIRITKHPEWGMTWWDFSFEGVEYSIEISYTGSELYAPDQTAKGRSTARRLGLQLAECFNTKYQILQKTLLDMRPGAPPHSR